MGNAGSGKTTLGRRLAAVLGAPFVELDSIHHLPGWTPIDRDELRTRVGELCATDTWVIDGNYGAVRDLVLARADTVVFLDLPRPVVMWQVTRRSLRRVRTGEELWNGNREEWRFLRSTKKEDNILLWAWTQHGKYRRRYLEVATDPALAQVTVVRLRSRREIDSWLDRVNRSGRGTSGRA